MEENAGWGFICYYILKRGKPFERCSGLWIRAWVLESECLRSEPQSPFVSCVFLGKSVNTSVPQFLHL